MPFVVIGLKGENMADGSFHVYSPNVPGFHVVDENKSAAYERASSVLRETLVRRMSAATERKDGTEINIHVPAEIYSFVPGELKRGLEVSRNAAPEQLIVEIR